MRVTFVIASLGVLSVSSSTSAQLVMGRVLDKQNRTPLRRVEVRLLPDTGGRSAAFASATTDSSGEFYVDAPGRGSYRLEFVLPGMTLFSSPFAVNTEDVQHEYVLDTQPARTYFEFEVSKQVWPLPNQPHPRYPERMRQAYKEGVVLAEFVVDTLGQADIATFKVLRTPHPDFTAAVLAVLPALRYTSAEVDHRKVKQIVHAPFVFCLDESPLPWVHPDTSKFERLPRIRPTECTGR